MNFPQFDIHHHTPNTRHELGDVQKIALGSGKAFGDSCAVAG